MIPTEKLTLKKIKSAFTILYLISLCDNHVSHREFQVIQEFLQSTFPTDHFSFNSTPIIHELLLLSAVDQHSLFMSAALTFKNLTNIQQRLDFLHSAIRLIYADHKVEPNEQILLDSLAYFWNIKLPPFLTTPKPLVVSYNQN